VLDLSSFKCGHDAPTYGIIDSIISAAGSPYAALHDIDANKPGGSIKIRVKTYSHSLQLHRERLEDIRDRKDGLQHAIERKRLELLQLKQSQLAARSQKDDALEQLIASLGERVQAYELARKPRPTREQAEEAADEMKKAGIVRLGIKKTDGDSEVIARI
jgi:hypothetical protein